MTPNDLWQQVERAFKDLADLDSDAVDRYLENLDPVCAREVRELLEAEEKAEQLLEETIAKNVAAWASGEEELGRKFGPYRLADEIGHGGMSSVYLAFREDDHYRQTVAVKLIRKGMDTPEIRSRFRRERQILANLNHEHIAQVFDGGTTPEGLPYIVMEYIEGQTVDQFCNENALSMHHRIQIFQKICGAVHYAHQQLVIHRDLKPGNVLMTKNGVPKLLDFGIAKLLEPGSEYEESESTLWGQRPMTPGYASPEQISGQAVTTASDTYSLGVLLYHLLTGHRPFGPSQKRFKPMVDRILHDEPTKPSELLMQEPSNQHSQRMNDGLSREQRARKLKGDLDAIVIKTLRKEPENRYASPAELSADLDRYLKGHPVNARHGNTAYYWAKFIKRHWMGTSAVSAILLSVFAALGVFWWQKRKATEERTRAELISGMLTDLFESADSLAKNADAITGKELLDQGTARLANEHALDARTRAEFLKKLGGLYESMGLYEEADQRYGEVLVHLGQVRGGKKAELGEMHHAKGRVLAAKGDYQEALAQIQKALTIRKNLYGDIHEDIAASYNNLALVYHDLGRLREAENMYRHALDLDIQIYGENHLWTSITMSNLVLLWFDQGKYQEAETLAESVITIQKARADPYDKHYAVSLQQFGMVLHALGRFQEAETIIQEALDVGEKMFGEKHPDQARIKKVLATILRDMGSTRNVEQLYLDVLAEQKAYFGVDHIEVAQTQQEFGWFLLERGRDAEAQPILEQSLKTLQTLLPPEAHLVVEAKIRMGIFLQRTGACGCALYHLEPNVPILTAQHPHWSAANLALAACHP